MKEANADVYMDFVTEYSAHSDQASFIDYFQKKVSIFVVFCFSHLDCPLYVR